MLQSRGGNQYRRIRDTIPNAWSQLMQREKRMMRRIWTLINEFPPWEGLDDLQNQEHKGAQRRGYAVAVGIMRRTANEHEH